jgi:hypothetical protein
MNFVVTGGIKGTDWTYSKDLVTNKVTVTFKTATDYTITFPKVDQPLDYAIVGGGGGGGGMIGQGGGGGGGGGQVLEGSLTLFSATSYNVTVGGGGGEYVDGNDSLLYNLTANGGKHGYTGLGYYGGKGGYSGGGGKYNHGYPPDGGLGGGGNGGDSTADVPWQNGYDGMDGILVSFNNTYYGGGGGGTHSNYGGSNGIGGNGGGGGAYVNGTPYTGGGGGGRAQGGSGVVILSFTPVFKYPCFKEGSKILTNKGYRKVEELRKGDLIQTLSNGLLPIDMIGTSEMYNSGDGERIKDRLYTCSRLRYRELLEDLVITGCHSVLVKDFKDDNEANKTKEILGDNYVTDDHYRLPACVDQRSIPYPVKGTFNIYHIALENDDYYGNYGVYANGLLVETCSKRYLKELSNMKLIE